MLNPNANLSEQVKFVRGYSPGTPTSATPDYVSLKGYSRCTVVIMGQNASTVTGSAITMKQATSVAGAGEKALPVAKAYVNADTGAADTLAETTVNANTFTTDVTNTKESMYVIEVSETDLDINNGFDCIRAGAANAVNTTLSVLYILWPAKFGGNQPKPSAIVD